MFLAVGCLFPIVFFICGAIIGAVTGGQQGSVWGAVGGLVLGTLVPLAMFVMVSSARKGAGRDRR